MKTTRSRPGTTNRAYRKKKEASKGYELRPASKEIPLERIFRKIVGRKMTVAERLCFRLKPTSRIARGKPRKNKL